MTEIIIFCLKLFFCISAILNIKGVIEMTNEELLFLEAEIGAEKTYLKDGYYRIRENNFGQKELAFLIPDGCGTTSVHPQITLEKVGDNWQAIKLIDMGVSPTIMLEKNPETEQELDTKLDYLFKKMTEAIENQ